MNDIVFIGGINRQLTSTEFSVQPTSNVVATPNTVLATPFRSQRSEVGASPAFNTPGSVKQGGMTVVQTPVRDKLNINEEGVMEASETPNLQKQVKF